MNFCRCCGCEKPNVDFNVELNDTNSSNWTYRELIEHHSRVILDSNKLLPQNICSDCQKQIDGFSEFSAKLQNVQNSLTAEDEEYPTEIVKECFVHVDEVTSPVDDDTDWDEFQDDQPLLNKKISKKSGRLVDHLSVEEIFKNQLVTPTNIQLAIKDSERLENGEILESALASLKLTRWSDLIKSCELCNVSVSNLIELNTHQEKIHSVKELEISCGSCETKFKRIFGFINHTVSKHADHLKHCCLLCDKIFYDLDFLLQHVKDSHAQVLRQIWQCLVCGQYRDSFTTLKKHNEMVHLKQLEIKKRTRSTSEELLVIRSKRSKRVVVKVEDESASNDSGSEYNEEVDSDEQEKPLKRRSRTTSKRINTKISAASDVDTFEKLFADEIAGISPQGLLLHLNVNECHRLDDGEVPDEYAIEVSKLRWRDVLSCGVCQIPFTNIDDLLAHVELKHNARTKVFSCNSCDGEFTAISESILINHLVERHFQEHLKFCCLYCSKMFYDLPALVRHYKTHNGRFVLNLCLWCGWYAKTLDDLKEHKAYHGSVEKSANQLLCEQVFEKFNSGSEPSLINECIADFERNPDGSVTDECQRRFAIDWSFGCYQCPRCVIDFTNPFELFVHQRLKHPKEHEKKIFSCSLCIEKKEYSNLYTFVNHATSKHLEGSKFTCVVCSRVHWSFLALAQHYKSVHPSFPCVFCCHCGKIFMNVTIASSHFKSLNLLRSPEERKLLKEGKIQEETSHICHVCAKSFKSRGTLLNHVKTHEALQPQDLLQCHICSKFYKNKYKLAQHMVCHEDARSWKCKICGQAFNYKKLLQRHIQAVHENERNFGCTFCEKRFNSKYDLTVHIRLHTGEFPYECPITDCGAKYPAWSNLYKHCSSRHKLDIRSEGYKKLKATQKSQKSVEDYETE